MSLIKNEKMEELEIYLEKAQAADESISSFTEVVGNVPTPWEKGDVITFPATIKGNAFKTKIGNKKYEYIVVHVKSADGSERQANFFPPLFRRRARVCEWKTVDGVDVTIPTNDFVVAGGSIVEQLYTKKRKVNDVVLAVLGKSIKISEVHEVKSQEFGTNNPELAKVYDFEPEGWTIGDAPIDIPEDTTTDSDAVKEIYDISIKQETFLLGDIYMKDIPLIEDWGMETKEAVDIKPQKKRNGQHYGREWVDLGLPSDVKWAACNVGASSPEEYGNYYDWGETSTSSEYVEGNCSTYGKSMSDISGDAQYDVARNCRGLKLNYSIYVVNGKMGIGEMGLSHEFNLITQPKYDVIYPFVGEYAVVKIGDKMGLIDSKGREVMPVQYGYLYRLWGKVYWYECNGICYYNDFERQIFNQKCKYEEYMDSISNILHIEIDRILVDGWDEDNERFGFGSFLIDKEQRIVYSEKLKNIILPNYNIESCDFETDIFIISKNGKYGIANSYGKILAPLQYDRIEWSDSGMFRATIGNKEGFIDACGNVKIAFNYDLVGDFCKGLTWVALNGKSGVIDFYGRLVVPMGDYSIRILENGTIVMVTKHIFEKTYAVYGWPSINLQRSYDDFDFNFKNPNLVRVKSGYSYGVIKLNGEIVLEAIYDFIPFDKGNHIVVKMNKKYGIMDLNGRTILPITYDYISLYGGERIGAENLFYIVCINNKTGLMNQRMQLVIPIQYDDITYDSEYNANIVKIGNEYGMVDFEHNILIPFSKNYL